MKKKTRFYNKNSCEFYQAHTELVSSVAGTMINMHIHRSTRNRTGECLRVLLVVRAALEAPVPVDCENRLRNWPQAAGRKHWASRMRH